MAAWVPASKTASMTSLGTFFFEKLLQLPLSNSSLIVSLGYSPSGMTSTP